MTTPAIATARSGARVGLQAGFLWLMMLTMSALPIILWRELSGTPAPVALLLAKQAVLGLGLLLTCISPALRPSRGALVWMNLFSLGWSLTVPLLTQSPAWLAWRTEVPWITHQLAVQSILLAFSGLMALTLLQRKKTEVFLGVGDPRATAARDVLLLNIQPSRWNRLAPLWALPISAVTLLVMILVYRPPAEAFATLLPLLPFVVLAAALNAFNEEWQFRNVAFSHLAPLLRPTHALAFTSVGFGLAHFYGNPPGYPGVLLAGWLGYVLGKSMQETRGSLWAWAIHFVQDVIIFSFLAMMLR